MAEFDKAICEYIDSSYHDGEGGDSATGVRWWILFNVRGLGEPARRVLGPDASLDAKLKEELVVLRFACWLVEVRGVTPETARKYVSTVQAWHERRFGVRLAGGLRMARLPAMLKGMVRKQGGRRHGGRGQLGGLLHHRLLWPATGGRDGAGAAQDVVCDDLCDASGRDVPQAGQAQVGRVDDAAL